MSDENELEIEVEPNYEAGSDLPPHMEVLPPEKVIRAGVGMKTVLVLSILAALAGAFGGAAISQAVSLKSPADDNVQSQLESFSQEKDTLRREVSQLEESVNSLKTQKPKEITTLETRLKKLERERAPADESAFADIGARVEALENSPATQQAGNVVSEDLLGRIEALEKQAPNEDLNEIVDRLDRLEVQSVTQPQKSQMPRASRAAAPSAAPVQTILIPPFPRAEVLKAAGNSGQGGWLNRTLDKHVQIRDADEASPENLADQIQTYLDMGEFGKAIATFDTLPSKARSAGKAWRDAVAADIKANP